MGGGGEGGAKAKKIVINAFNYFMTETGKKITAFMNQMVQAKEVGLWTVYNITKDTSTTASPALPNLKQKRGPYKPVDNFDEITIRNNVYKFYTVRRQLPACSSEGRHLLSLQLDNI